MFHREFHLKLSVFRIQCQEIQIRIDYLHLWRKLNVSRSTLFRAFKEEVGRSPKQVFDDLRMQKAEHLLRASTETVKEIADACGYAGEAYFSRAFKARRGLPPGTWRRRVGGTDRRGQDS